MDKTNTTKEHIKKAASELFQKYGYNKTTMNDIAKYSHKAKRSIYNHFENKETLYAAVVNDEIDSLKNSLLPIINQKNLNASIKCANYLSKRMKVMQKLAIYNNFINDSFFNRLQIQHKKELLQIVIDFNNWEFNQLEKIIEEGKAKNEILDNIKTKAFIDIIMMVVKSLEVSFFVKKNYKSYFPTFNSLLINVIQAISPNSNEIIKEFDLAKYSYTQEIQKH